MKKFLFLFTLLVSAYFSVAGTFMDEPAPKTYVVFTTEYGEVKALLYDETPLHKENFIKNVRAGIYDSLLFHRVIKNFMVQGGDPDSKNAADGALLGNGGLDYTVAAEIKPNLFHKRGALCAARQSDDVNPKKESSSTQFYIVQGQVYTDKMLAEMEARVNQMTQNGIFFELLAKPEYAEQKKMFEATRENKDVKGAQQLYISMMEEIKKIQNERGGEYKISAERKEAYKTVGGAAHLDGNYTVFGEVVSGMEVIDKIAMEEVDANNRPKKNIRFSVKIVYE